LEGTARAASRITEFAERITTNIETVIVGKRPEIELLMVALLCGGNVLIEDVPGTGKTMLARAVAGSMGLEFKRLQCTPDLLPNDVTGVSIFNNREGNFQFQPGPVFANILLADEINRATPRTQAAMLEAMQEHQVSVDGVSHLLPTPFLLMATQNPVEYEGTFPLPEAQLDRFLLRMSLGYPAEDDEIRMLRNLRGTHPIDTLQPVVDGKELLALYPLVNEIHVDETLERYILALVTGTRRHPDVAVGASPRGSLALYKTAQARAALSGREYVLPDDVKAMAPSVLPHRIIVKPESELRGRSARTVIGEVLDATVLEIGEGA
jgi:MoxR-like ATPase